MDVCVCVFICAISIHMDARRELYPWVTGCDKRPSLLSHLAHPFPFILMPPAHTEAGASIFHMEMLQPHRANQFSQDHHVNNGLFIKIIFIPCPGEFSHCVSIPSPFV